jgi:broad specificity phosphatase PhoE
VFWRHGLTEWNAAGRFQGQTDVDLHPTGVEQAARAARLLAALSPSAIVSSDLRRARDTAAELAKVTGLSVAYDERLRETYAGRWQGLTGDEIRDRWPEEMAAWERGDPEARPGGGETRAEVADRQVAAVRRALQGVSDGETLVVVTHGGAARVAICRLLGFPEATWTAVGVLSNCSWSVVSEGRFGWRLVEHNAGTLPEPVLSVEG